MRLPSSTEKTHKTSHIKPRAIPTNKEIIFKARNYFQSKKFVLSSFFIEFFRLLNCSLRCGIKRKMHMSRDIIAHILLDAIPAVQNIN